MFAMKLWMNMTGHEQISAINRCFISKQETSTVRKCHSYACLSFHCDQSTLFLKQANQPIRKKVFEKRLYIIAFHFSVSLRLSFRRCALPGTTGRESSSTPSPVNFTTSEPKRETCCDISKQTQNPGRSTFRGC